ncbi:hypothetical protein FJT64_016394 [Amphibalanus amphitrite]|uniref:Uncharacterized protein n=1 Tax=Amphibalanus amphitrite TaxID=1232801 RepID=A0A6A4X130_AMPAM|nr:hypothetical protein FJT64_016394 [Amphibalanus amphitrite]
MGNHHSQAATELGPGWSRTIPRERTAGRLLGYGKTPALQPAVKVLPDRVPGQKLRISASLPSEGVAASGARPTGDLQRSLNDFMSTLERSKRRQLSVSRDEILTHSPARSYRSQSSVFDCELQLGTESISMHLRPSLPKKQQQMPRFSPLAAWKSLHLDETERREWREEPLTKQPLREQLCRHRPIAQSADSGIGGDAGSPPPPPSPHASAVTRADTTTSSGAEVPLAASSPSPAQPRCWTPAQDLEEASSGDDASMTAAEARQGTLPKLTSRGGIAHCRLIEKKKLESQLSREAEEKERRRREEQEAMQRVEREFLQKRRGESRSVERHRLGVSRLESDGERAAAAPAEPPTSSDVTFSGSDSDRGFSSHKESAQSSPRSVGGVPLPQFQLPAGGAPGRADPYWDDSKPPECPPPDYNSLPPLLDQHPISLPPPEQPLPPPAERVTKPSKSDRPRLLSGVRNWLRGRRDGANMARVRREEPEGQAESSPDRQLGPSRDTTESPRWGTRRRRQTAPAQIGRTTVRPSVAATGHRPSRLPTLRDAIPSSGYDSSPSLGPPKRSAGAAKRLTHELADRHQERREYRDYRSPVTRYRYRTRFGPRLQNFQRSRSHHELHFRGSLAPAAPSHRYAVSRGRSEERLDAGGWPVPPPPARPPPHHLMHPRGYVPRYINNSPARYAHGVEHSLLNPGHRPLALLPPRPASAFQA